MSSYSVAQHTDQSTTQTTAADFGMGTSNNVVLGGGANYSSVYNEQGITGDNLDSLLGTVRTLSGDTNTTLSNTLSSVFNKMTESVQSSASKAIDTTAEAYAESKNELRSALDGLRPIVLYVAFAAVAYYLFRGSK